MQSAKCALPLSLLLRCAGRGGQRPPHLRCVCLTPIPPILYTPLPAMPFIDAEGLWPRNLTDGQIRVLTSGSRPLGKERGILATDLVVGKPGVPRGMSAFLTGPNTAKYTDPKLRKHRSPCVNQTFQSSKDSAINEKNLLSLAPYPCRRRHVWNNYRFPRR